MRKIKFLFMSDLFDKNIETILEEYFVNGKLSDGTSNIIKDNNARRILSIDTSNRGSYILKGYKKHGLLNRLKSIFFGSEGKREFTNLNKLQKINTSQALCLFKIAPVGKDSCMEWLCLKKIENAKTLKEIFVSNEKINLKGLASFVVDFLNKGIFHKDIHCGNILVSQDEKFFLLDAKEVSFFHKMPIKKHIQTCAMLAYSISFIKNSYYGLKFIKAFYETDELAKSNMPLKSFLKIILQLVNKKRVKHLKDRVKKSIREKLKFDDYKLIFKDKFSRDDVLTKLIHSINGTVGKDSVIETITKQTKSRRIGHLVFDNIKIFFKEHRYGYIKGLVKNIYRSCSRKSWSATEGLKLRQFPIAENILLIEKQKHLSVQKEILYSEFISGLPIPEFIKKNFKKRAFLSALASFIRKLHNYGVYHKDLKANNILVQEMQDNFKFYLVDLDRLYFKKILKEEEKIKNLAQLNASVGHIISKSDRLFFFMKYLQKKLNRIELRKFVNKIMILTIKRKHFWP